MRLGVHCLWGHIRVTQVKWKSVMGKGHGSLEAILNSEVDFSVTLVSATTVIPFFFLFT